MAANAFECLQIFFIVYLCLGTIFGKSILGNDSEDNKINWLKGKADRLSKKEKLLDLLQKRRKGEGTLIYNCLHYNMLSILNWLGNI